MPGQTINTNLALVGLTDVVSSSILRSGATAVNSVNGQNLSVQNIATAKLANVWRSTNLFDTTCWVGGDITSNQRTIEAISIIGHNMIGFIGGPYTGPAVASGKWRYRGVGWKGNSVNSLILRPKPLAIVSSTNLVGSVTALQDIDPNAPDVNWLTASSSSANTSLTVSFQNPTQMDLDTTPVTANVPFTLPIAQCFVVALRRTTTGGSGAPGITFTLMESGVSRGTLTVPGFSNISSTTGVTLYVYWSASVLSAIKDTGAVQLKIDGTTVGGNTIEVGGVEWHKEVRASGISTYNYQDSGWVSVVLPKSYTDNPAIPGPPFIETYFPPSMTIDSFHIDFNDSAPFASYLQCGKIIISSLTTFNIGVDFGWGISYNDPSTKGRTKGGSVYINHQQPWREFTGELTGLNDTEAQLTILDQLDRGFGTSKSFVAIIHPSDPNFLYMRTMYCQQYLVDGAQNSDSIVTFDSGVIGDGLYSRKLYFEEVS